jgi:hypothetical protein
MTIRIFAVYHDAPSGTHVHLLLSGHAWKDTLAALRLRYSASSAAGRPLFFDLGTGSDLVPLCKVTQEFNRTV